MSSFHPAGSALGRMALAIALEEQAAGAIEIGENNSGPWVVKYIGGVAPPPQPWCAGLVSWCFHAAADCLDQELPFAYTLGARDLFDQLPRIPVPVPGSITIPAPGDIVGWWRGSPASGAGHVGIVLDVSPKGVLYTLEGNRGRFPIGIRTIGYVMNSPQFSERLLGFGRVGT